MKMKTRRIITLTVLAGLTIGGLAMIPTKTERTLNKINKDINNKVLRLENIIEGVELNFDDTSKELELDIKINPIEEDIRTGKEAKDLILYQSKDLAEYTLKELNNIVNKKTGANLKQATTNYYGGLYDFFNTTVKVYRNDGYIYSYDIIENNQLRTLK